MGKGAISYIGPKIWNDIENQIKQLKTIETFKGKIKKSFLTDRSTSEKSY